MKILKALIVKEFHQIVRDPSSILIAFVLPFILLLIYMYAINLDTLKIRVGLKVDDDHQQVSSLVDAFKNNKYMTIINYTNKNKMYDDLVSTKLRGIIVIPNDFTKKLDKNEEATIQVITDGSEVNLANYVQSYPKSIIQEWLYLNREYKSKKPSSIITPQVRFWYNQDVNSHYFILPGSLAITMTLIGMLLTALVIAREWERGTMEALITTRARKSHIVLGKYFSYYLLGIASMCFSVFLCIAVFKIPFRGSYLVLFGFSSLFLFTALGQGLLISTILKNQFTASQAALIGGFLPALMLSGLLYPISSMPKIIQFLTIVIPSRYFVACIQSEFLVGTVWQIILPNSIFLLILSLLLFCCVYTATKTRLD